MNLDKDPHVGEHHTSPLCRAEISARNRHPVTVSFGDMRFGFPCGSAQTSGAKIPRQNNVPIEQQHVCSLEVAPTMVRKTKTVYRGDGKVTKRYPPKTRVAVSLWVVVATAMRRTPRHPRHHCNSSCRVGKPSAIHTTENMYPCSDHAGPDLATWMTVPMHARGHLRNASW